MADKKDIKNKTSNFPRGALEEMLRMMKEGQENGNIDCESVMKEFMNKNFKCIDYKILKDKFFKKKR